MTEVGHDRLYNVLLRRLGLKTLQGMKVDDTVQPVAIVDDFTDLTRPLVGATFGDVTLGPAVAARFSIAELFTGPAAGWLLWWRDNVGAGGTQLRVRISRDATLITADLATVTTRVIRAGDQEQSATSRWRVQSGTSVGAPVGLRVIGNEEWINPLFLPPGTMVAVSPNVNNTLLRMQFLWVELPDV